MKHMQCGRRAILAAANLSQLLRRPSAESQLLRRPTSYLRRFSAMASPEQPKDEEYLNKVIPKRIQLFQSIQAIQKAHIESLPHEPIK